MLLYAQVRVAIYTGEYFCVISRIWMRSIRIESAPPACHTSEAQRWHSYLVKAVARSRTLAPSPPSSVPLNDDELAFYDALANKEASVRELGDEIVAKIAH